MTEAMRIDSSGNVGVGTSSPSDSLSLGDGLSAGFNASSSGDTTRLRWRYTGTEYAWIERVNANGSLAFGVQGSEAMRIDSIGNLGLGVTPSAWLSTLSVLQFGGAGGIWSTSAATNNTSIGSNVYYNSSATPKYIGSDEATQYQQLDGEHIWRTAASGTAGNTISFSEAMRIDSSGRVGIGTSTPLEFNTTGSSFARLLTVYSSGTSSPYRGEIQLGNAATTDGQFVGGINFGSGASATTSNVISAIYGVTDGDNTTLGQGELHFYTAASGSSTERMRLDSAGNLLVGTTTSPSDTGTVVADGIYLGGTAAANLLDDYEEGTWTPVLTGATSGTYTFAGNNAYTKVGNQVTLWAEAVAANGTANFGTLVGNASITGLPFTPAVDAVASIYYYDYSGTGTPYALIIDGSTNINIRKFEATTANNTVDGGDIDGTNQIRLCITYQV